MVACAGRAKVNAAIAGREIKPDLHCQLQPSCLGPAGDGYLCTCACAPCQNMMYPPEPKKAFDPINRPKHYTDRKFEPIDVIVDNGWAEGFCLGNAYKYMARAGLKPGEPYLKDMKKSKWYLDFWVKAVEEKRVDVPRLLEGPPEGGA